MKGKRRKITAEFKTQVVIEALKDRMTLAELSVKFNVAGSQISSWKTDFVKKSPLVFGMRTVANNEEEMERLYCKIGQLQLENDYLKKTLK